MSTKSTSVELAGLSPAQTAALIGLCGAEIGKSGLSGLVGQFILEDGHVLKRLIAQELERIAKRVVKVWPTNLTLQRGQTLYDLIEQTGWIARDLADISRVISREKSDPSDPEKLWDYYLVRVSNRMWPRQQSGVLHRFGFRGCTVRELLSWLLTSEDAERIVQKAFSELTPIVASGDVWGQPSSIARTLSAQLGKLFSGGEEDSQMSREIFASNLENQSTKVIHLCARER